MLSSRYSLRHLASLFLLCACTAAAQTSSLTVNSASSYQGGTVPVGVVLSVGATDTLAALQWTISYPPGTVASMSIAPGPALAAAGKSLYCNSTSGSVSCLAAGTNASQIGAGIVATATVTLGTAATGSSVPIGLSSSLGSAPSGDLTMMSGSGGTITVAAIPVSIGTLACSPSSVMPGVTSTCTAKYIDTGGYQSLDWVQMLIHGSFTGVGACWVQYSRTSNQLYLVNDQGTQILGPATLGVTGTLQNSQCTVNTGTSTKSNSGNTLTLNLKVVLQAGFVGAKNVYLQAHDNVGADSGWWQKGTLQVGGGTPSTSTYSSPSTGTYAFTSSDTGGFQSLDWVQVLINGSFAAVGACWVQYSRADNQLFMINDLGTQVLAPVTLGVAGTLQNSQCSINAAASSVSGSGNNLTLTLAITFQSGFIGTKNVYQEARDFTGADSGWQQRGTLALGAGMPTAVSYSSLGAGTYGFVFADTGGYQSLDWVQVLINGSFTGVGACWIQYSRMSNQLLLVNDLGTQVLASVTIGTAGTLQNSQCSINTGSASVSGSGNTLTLTLPITFRAAFTGMKNIYLEAHDFTGADSAWQQRGTLAAGGGTPSTVSFNSLGGGVYAAVYSDTAGIQGLDMVQVLIHNAFTGTGACWIQYSRASNQLYLVNDLGTQVLAPVTLGTAGTLQNSQCSVNVAASSVSVSGNNLTLTLSITFQAAFMGTKNTYLDALDITGADTKWQLAATGNMP